MNVDDIVKYQPSVPGPQDDPEEEDETRGRKRPRVSAPEAGDDGKEDHVMDESSVRRLLLSFDRRVQKNREMRVKFPDDGTKFMDSEMQLFSGLQELQSLSVSSERVYDMLVMDGKLIPSLMGLLSHENSDVACAVVRLLDELTDGDDEGHKKLMRSLVHQQLIPLLVHNMQRLDEAVKEEEDAVFHSLSIIENMTDVDPGLVSPSDSKLIIDWIFARLKTAIKENRGFDSNSLYASEILSILVQNNSQEDKSLGSEGMDVLLQTMSCFRKREPGSSEESELLQNVVNVLCSSFSHSPENRRLFLAAEGLQLMALILRDKRTSGCPAAAALKVLTHLLTPDSETPVTSSLMSASCESFVTDVSGLRLLFPILMRPKLLTSGGKKKKDVSLDLVEEESLTILLSLLRSSPDVHQQKRLVSKFVEYEFEKTERLLELHHKYCQRVKKFDQKLEEESEDEDEDELYVRRLTDGGLFVLQIVDQILVTVCLLYEEFFSENKDQESVKQRLLKLLKTQGGKEDELQVMRQVLTQMADNMDDEAEKNRLRDMVSRF